MSRRVVVVGGDAAGMTAATTAKRRGGDDLEVVVFERTGRTSYSACGIPYWIAGDVGSADALVARTPQQHRDNGIDLRLHSDVVAVDPDAGTVTVRSDGTQARHGYDDLVIATGAEPIRPDLPGIGARNVLGVQSLDDGQAILEALDGARRAVIVGSGYIGVEMAEACLRHGLTTTLVDRAETPMSLLDPALGAKVRDAMAGLGIELRLGAEVTGFDTEGGSGAVRAVSTDAGSVEADVVILGIGVQARSELAWEVGLPVGDTGAIRVDAGQRVDAERHVWAAGDCVESMHRITRRPVYVPLGTHANKQGRVLGRNLTGDDARFAGVLGTAMTKVCDLEIGITGLSEQDAREAGFDPVTVSVDVTTRAGYMPDASDLTVMMVGDRRTRRVLGAQLVGGEDSVLRVDTVAMALWTEMTADDLMSTDLGYAPPFSAAWDPVQVAARALAGALDGDAGR